MAEDREEQIRQRAYRIWQDEGEPAGREQEHWSRAETELGSAATDGNEEAIAGDGGDLPFGEPEDTGGADAALGGSEAAPPTGETPQTSGVAAAADVPAAPAPFTPAPITKGRKGRGGGKPAN